jgi:hypothetical protein
MKKIIGIVLSTLVVQSVTAQVLLAILFGDKLNTDKIEFGIAVNPVFTNITGVEGKYRNGLDLAIYFDFKIKSKFFIHVEGVAKGAFGEEEIATYHTGLDTVDILFADGNYERKIKAFSMPVLARYAISKKLFIDAGIRADWMLKSKDIFKTKLYDNDLEYTMNVSEQITKLDFGLTGGLHYKFRGDRKSMGVGFRYFQGLTDIIKTTAGTQANTAWEIVITIPIGGNSTANGNNKSPQK